MTTLPPHAPASYPSVDMLLAELRRRRWAVHLFGARETPHLVGAVLAWGTCADVVLLRGEDDASAFRTPTIADADVFAPELVSWQYHAPAAWTLRAVLTIEPPGSPGAPQAVECPAAQCTVPTRLRRPATIRPGRAAPTPVTSRPGASSQRGELDVSSMCP